MMDLYQKNKAISDLGIKAFLAITKESEENAPHKFLIENFPAKNNSVTCKISKEGKEPILVHSSYDPQKEADSMADNLDYSKHSLFIVFGIGLLYHIEKIMELASPRSRIAIIEPSLSIYNNAMKNKDMKKIFKDPRIILIIGIHPSLIPLVLDNADRPKSLLLNIGHNIQILETNYYKKFYSDTSEILKEIRKITEVKWRMLGNCHVDHNIGVVQSMVNIDYVIESTGIKEVKDLYKDKAVIIVGAGPSLDKNIQELKKAKGKMLIFAVDAVMEKLIKNGINPDMVITLERLGVYENLFQDRDYNVPKDIVLGAPTLSEMKIFEVFKDNPRLIFFPEGVGTQEYYDDQIGKGVLGTGTSAVYVAVNMATYMGCNKIAFAGLDLAYGCEGKIYCEGINKKGGETEAERMEKDEYLCFVKDYEGNELRSNFIWKDQLILLECHIKLKAGISFYDATEGGAKKEGTTIIKLKKFIEEFSSADHKDFPALLKEKRPEIDKKKIYKKLIQKFSEDYEKFNGIFEEIKEHFKNLKNARKLITKNYNNLSNNKIDKCIEIIQNSEKLIQLIEKEKFLYLYYQGLIAAFKKEANQIGKMELIESIKRHIGVHYEYFDLINGIFKYNLDHFDYIKEHIKKKLNDEIVEDNIIKILSYILKKNDINPNLAKEYFGSHGVLDEINRMEGETKN